MPVSSLYIANVGPFNEIQFEFDPHVNVFTGPNNCGKSSALWVLGDITVYPFSFPEKLLRPENPGKFRLCLGADSKIQLEGELPCHIFSPGTPQDPQGFWNSERSKEHIAVMEKIGYSKFIPALRQTTDFRSPGPTAIKKPDPEMDLFQITMGSVSERNLIRSRLARSQRAGEEESNAELKKRVALTSANPSLVSDEAVIQKIIELDYRSYLRREPAVREIITKIATITSEITDGFPIEFIGVDEDTSGFFPKFGTIDGAVPLNTLSQGTQSIIQWLAHLLIGYAEYYDFPEALEDKPGVLIIDEIDAHLHPSWQQRIIPTLTDHFPNLQIFCSTHSPLMLAGLKEGQVQLLQRNENGKVTVTRNEVDIIGWTADEILRNFLGVLDPTDLEASGRLERLQSLRNRESLSAEEADELETLRSLVSEDLVRGPISTQLEQFAAALTQQRRNTGE